MTAYSPPLYSFPNLNFNPTIFETTQTSSGFTQAQADLLYLQKTTPDTAVALETFSDGIITTFIDNTTNLTIGNPYYSTIIDGTVFIQNPVSYPDNSTKVATTSYVTSAINALSSIYQTATQVTSSINSAITTLKGATNTWSGTNSFYGITTPSIEVPTLNDDLSIGSVSQPNNIYLGTSNTVTSAFYLLTTDLESYPGSNLSIGQNVAGYIFFGGYTNDTYFGSYANYGNNFYAPIFDNLSGTVTLGNGNYITYLDGLDIIVNYPKTYPDNTSSVATTSFVTSAISSLSSIYQTAAQVTTAITSYGYQTAAQVTTAITSYGYQTAAQVTTAITSYGYQTAAQVTTAITSYGYQTAAQVTSAITTLKGATNTWSSLNTFSGNITTPKIAFTSGNLTTAFFFQSGGGNVSTIPGTTVVSVALTYPATFPTGIYGVIVSNNSSSGNGPKCIMTSVSPTNTGFTLSVYNTTATSISTVAYSYIAYGY